MSNLDFHLQTFFTAINWSAMQLIAVTVFLFFALELLVSTVEKLVCGKTIGVQFYDVILLSLFILFFGLNMYKLGELKQVVSHITWHNTQGQAKTPQVTSPKI